MQSNLLSQCVKGVIRMKPMISTELGLQTMTTVGLMTLQQHRSMSRAVAAAATSLMSASGRSDKYLIVGLGNHDMPHTRHSVGMQVVDKLADYLHTSWKKDQKNCVGFIAKATISDDLEVVLLKPKMPMNVNGTSVSKTAKVYGIEPEHIYLVHDDIDKSLGKVQVKEQGSANGHNGVRSCMNSLRSDSMPRLKIGIDRPVKRADVADYVLSDFSLEEQEIINKAVDDCLLAIADHMAKQSGVKLRETLHLPETGGKTAAKSKV